MGIGAVDPLRWVLPRSDAGYMDALAARARSPHYNSTLGGLSESLAWAVALRILRFLWNGAFLALAAAQSRQAAAAQSGKQSSSMLASSSSGGSGAAGLLLGGGAGAGPALPCRPSKERQMLLDKLEEEAWVTAGGTLLLFACWRCLAGVSSFCGLHDTAGCLRGWPLIKIDAATAMYYNIELGWYLQLMLKHTLGLGLADNSTMRAHHIATVALVVLSYMLNVHLLGLMVFAVLNVSSPLLHLSKLASSLELRRTRTAVFAVFSLAFFVTRVVLFPYVIVKCAMYESMTVIRGVAQYFLPFWLACNVLLGVLCAMQCVWFMAVLRVLRAALAGSSAKLAAEMRADPAGSGAKLVTVAAHGA